MHIHDHALLAQHRLSPLFSGHMANTTDPLWTTTPTWLWPPLPAGGSATWTPLHDRVEDHLWGTTLPLSCRSLALPFCSHECYAFNYFMSFSQWVHAQKASSPKLNSHHTHNFKCFSPFHFPFFFINSFNFLAFANQLNIPTSTH